MHHDLFQQYPVNMYIEVVSQHLYARNKQKKLKAKTSVHLQDDLRTDGDIRNTGQIIILPS